MADAREERLARNEAQFREVNERLPANDVVERPLFFCECGARDCLQTLHMSNEEYAAVRSDPLQFVIKPGHEIPDVEDVVSRHEDFFVVRKPEDLRPVVD